MDHISVEIRIESLASPGIKPGLSRVARLLKNLGNPQHVTKAIHVVGTNGKGSTAATLYSVLLKSGYVTALYTSPHLVDFEERLILNGRRSLSLHWHTALDRIENAIKHDTVLVNSPPTFFEITTVAAILIMAAHRIEVAVVEAGMGGRFDATNILTNVICSVICQIDIDHKRFLGNSLEEIAYEKFAVIRKSALAFFYGNKKLNEVFSKIVNLRATIGKIFVNEAKITNIKCSLRGTEFSLRIKDMEFEKYKTPLLGIFAAENVAFAVYISRCLMMSCLPNINKRAIQDAVSTVSWQGRFEIISNSPAIILDGGHNPHAIKKLTATLWRLYNQKLTLIVAMMKDKDVTLSLANLKLLDANFIATEVPNNSRCMSVQEMAQCAEKIGLNVIGMYKIPLDAITKAKQIGNPIVVFGSLYLVGYVKKCMQVEQVNDKDF